ncbi:MAG: glycoside hydrolase domain-containing protein, partial [Syntrophothermus sp.]
VQGLINLMGGDEKFTEWMHSLFTTKFKEGEVDESDISGMIGQYAHGNEPSHHFAYLYNFAGAPWRTQEMVRIIMGTLYFDTPEGLCGNEDCGQMSAWYVLSAIGFYPVCPGQDIYEIGSPVFSKVTINLENGKRFVIKAGNNSPKNVYITEAKLNGSTYNKSFIAHSDIINGSVLELKMSDTPNKTWAAGAGDKPASISDGNFVMIPFLKQDQKNFISKMNIDLGCETEGAQIYYTLDGTEPTENSSRFISPIEIDHSVILKYRAFKYGMKPSYPVETRLNKTESRLTGDENSLLPGIGYKYYDGVFRSIWDFEKEQPESEGIISTITLDKRGRDEWFAMEFNGFIRIPEDGEYTFYVNADDGGQLTINGDELFESDGRKSFPFEQQSSVILKKGFHQIGVKYFQCSGNRTLEVSWESSKIKREPVPASALFHKKQN